MVAAILNAVALALASLCERLVTRSQTAVDADADPSRLRRAGSRLRGWVSSRRVSPRVESCENCEGDTHDGVLPR